MPIPAGGVDFIFEVAGERQIGDVLGIMSSRIKDWRPAWNRIHDDFTGHVMVQQFATQGARGPSGKWTDYRVEPVYAAYKKRVLGSKFPILRWATSHGAPQSGEKLYPSLVEQSDPNHVWKSTKASFEVGTSVPYAMGHQKGVGRQSFDKIPLPRRKIIDLTSADIVRWEKIMQRHVIESLPPRARAAMRTDTRAGGFYDEHGVLRTGGS